MALVVIVASVAVTGTWQLTVVSPKPAGAAPLSPGLTSLAGEHGVGRSRVDGTGSAARFREMVDVDVDTDGEYVYVLELGSSDSTIPDAVRQVEIATGVVSTYSTASEIQSGPAHIEVDPEGNPWVAASSPTTADTKALVKISSTGSGSVMLDGLHGYYDGAKAGDGFYIDPVGGFVYYSSGNAPGRPAHEPWLWRISLDSLPADADEGMALASMGDQYGGPVKDMEMGSDGRLYMVYSGRGLLRYDGASITATGAAATWHSPSQIRLGFVPGSSSLYNLCVGCHTVERRPSFGSEPRAVQSVVAGVDGSYGSADGDPGRLNSPVGLAMSPDGTKAWIADRDNNLVRELVLPPDPNRLSAEELCGPCNPGERRLVPPKVLDPVDVASGSLTESFTDMVVPARGMPLAATRTYNSLLSYRDGVFGPGWSSPLDISLEEVTGAVMVHQENGALLPFTRLDDGTITAPSRVTSTLEEVTGGWVLTRNRTGTVAFDSQGRVTGFEDRHGNETTVTYPSSTQIVMTSDGGRSLTFALNGAGLVESVTDDSTPARTVSYTYTSGNLTEVESFKVNDDDPAPVTWGYSYNPTSGLLEAVTNPRGDSNFTHYDTQGRVDYQLDYAGFRSDIVYGPDAPITWREVTTPAYDGIGTRSTTRYELENLLTTSVTTAYGTPDARTTIYEYDDALMGVDRVVGEGDVELARYDYDEHGNVELAVDAAGRETIYDGYDEFNQPGTITDNDGITTTFTYDDGYLEETSTPIVSPAGAPEGTSVTTYVRGDVDHPEDVTEVIGPDQQGGSTSHVFDYRDGDGLLNWEEDPEGNRTTYTYDSRGFVASVVSPRGNEVGADPDDFRTVFDVNDFGMVTSVTDPLGGESSQRFDGNGNTVETVDANLNETVTVFDEMNRPTLVERADGTEVGTTYFPNGALHEQINGLGQATTYGYDAHGAVISMADPLDNTTSYSYDDLGRLETRTDPGGSCPTTGCVTYGYNAGSELSAVTYSDPATPDVTTITYDDVGRRLSMGQSGRPASSWTWDSLGRMRSSTDINGRTVAYDYSPGGLLEEIAYPGQTTPVTYTYDDAGRMETVTDWASRVTTFDHDADGNWTDTTFPAASTNTDQRIYDEAGRLASVTWRRGSTVLGSLAYDRDDKGLLESETPTGVSGFSTQDWGYDPVDQLDQVNTAALDHDDAGNLTRTEGGRLQVFDPAQRLCWTSPSATSGTCESPATDATVYSYDDRGNRTGYEYPSGTSASFSYDQENRMTGAVVPDAGGVDGQYQNTSGGTQRVADSTSTTTPGTCDSSACVRLSASQTVAVDVLGVGTVPASGVIAVTGTLRAVDPGADGALTVNPNGSAAAATVPYSSGDDATGAFVAAVDNAGQITLSTTAATDVIVEISGYHRTAQFLPSSNYYPLTAARMADTHSGSSFGTCNGGSCSTLAASTPVAITATGVGGVPASGINAVVVSIIANNAAGAGTLRVAPSGAASAGTITLTAGQSSSQVLTVPLSIYGRFTVQADVAVDVVVHVSGYFKTPTSTDTGHVLEALTPTRVADTDAGVGTCNGTSCATLSTWTPVNVAVAGQSPVPGDANAVVANITATGGTGTGSLVIGANLTLDAAVALIGYPTGDAASQTVTVPLNPDGTLSLFSTTAVDVSIDVVGAYTRPTRSWSYTYDATGLRTSKQDGTATPYHFTWNRAAGLPLLLSQHVGSAVNHLIYGPGGTPIYQITSAGAVQYFHQDHQGSTRLVTDANGNTYGTITYDAYGRQTTNTSPWYLDRQLAGYTGEYTDAETGYTFLRARLLDHSTGQFTTRDPLESSTGEPYSYAGGSPLMRTDPSGLCWGPTCILPSPREVAEELVDRAGDAIESGRGAVRDTAREGWEVAREAATTAPGLSGRAIGALMRTNCRYSSADRVTYCEGSPTGRPVTIGNTVFMGMTHDQYAGRSGLHQHELRHVDQYALLGPLFLPLYGQASLSSIGTSLVLCPDPKMSMADRAACFNFLEIWSGRGSGGYSC